MQIRKGTEKQKEIAEKPANYRIRDRIEDIVKEKNIDRSRFGEFSKTSYADVIKRFYYAFGDYEKYPEVKLPYFWLHLREELKVIGEFCEKDSDWSEFLKQIRAAAPLSEESQYYYMLLSEGWVYKGCIDEIFEVLNEADGLLEDFYVVSRNFDWFIAYCSDGCYGAVYHK